MSYFGGSIRGAGDPGFFGALKGAIGGLITGGPLGAAAGAIRGFSGPPRQVQNGAPLSGLQQRAQVRQLRRSGQTSLTLGTFQQRQGLIPAVKGFFGGPPVFGPMGGPRRRRRMNPTNPKALRRAIRRTDAFVKVAKSALQNTGFKVVSKSAGKMTEAAWQKKAHHAK